MVQSAEKSLMELLRGFGIEGPTSGQRFQFVAELAHRIAVNGRKYYFTPATLSTLITGQQTFDLTTPTFHFRNPEDSGEVMVPLFFIANQAGTVAGGPVQIVPGIGPDRYNNVGTVLLGRSSRPAVNLNPLNDRAFANPTLSAANVNNTPFKVDGIQTGADTEAAESAWQQYIWTPTSVMDLIDPGYALSFWTWAAAPGPSWHFSAAIAFIPPEWVAAF